MIRILVVSLLLILSGCASTPVGSEPDNQTSIIPSETQDTAITSTDASVNETSTGGGGGPFIQINILTEEPVRVKMTELGANSRGVVHNHTYTHNRYYDIGHDDDGAITRDGYDYKTQIFVNESLQWENDVSRFEAYDLLIHENGTIEVTSHYME